LASAGNWASLPFLLSAVGSGKEKNSGKTMTARPNPQRKREGRDGECGGRRR